MLALLLAVTMTQTQAQARSAPPARYRLEVKTLRELDRSSMGGPKTADGLATSAIIAVTMQDSAGGQLARIVVDSIALSPTGAVVEDLQRHPTAVQDARGAWVNVYIAHGKIQGGVQLSDSTNPALGAIVQAVGVLFPGIRRGAKLGDSWADTSKINNASGPRRVSGEVIATWKVVANEGDALVLEGSSTSETRTEDGSGQVLTLTGGSKERVVIPPTGLARRASIETSSDMSITAPRLTSPIPGRTTGSLTLTPIP
ncbi:MAG: hypothetical protein ACRELE_07855 [Gemmatimonadales bacterium]